MGDHAHEKEQKIQQKLDKKKILENPTQLLCHPAIFPDLYSDTILR